MSTWNPRDIIRLPGRLVMNPTSLAGSYPWGGTELGVLRAPALIPNQLNYIIRAEEYGGIPVEAVRAGEAWVLVATLVSFDPTLMAKIFSVATTDTVTGRAEVQTPAYGTKVSDQAFKLLFSPDDTERHPFLVFYSVLPLVEESARIPLVAREEAGIAVAFHATYDANSHLLNWGMRQGITL